MADGDSGLFVAPPDADLDGREIPAGGVGSGNFTYTAAGEFREWRMHPGEPPCDLDVTANGFMLWVRDGAGVRTIPLREARPRRARAFPLTWDRYDEGCTGSVGLSSVAFSPVLPGSPLECSLPLYLWAWRLENTSDDAVEVAVLLTWQCGWPHPEDGAAFDLQHDNRCITASLGCSGSAERSGIAMPDLYSRNVLIQAVEAWQDEDQLSTMRRHFGETGEVASSAAPRQARGLAAWAKLDLDPGEAVELPFVACWHLPIYTSGPAAGRPRRYTEFLGKRRPDNALVWVAEQALEDFDTGTPGWHDWLTRIRDWHRTADPALLRGAQALLHTDTVWTADGRFEYLARTADDLAEVLASGVGANWLETGQVSR